MDADVELYLQTQLEKIRLLRETDKGEVWLAANKSGEPCILKKINFVGLPYKVLKKIQSPLCAKIFLCVEDERQTFIAEEFLSGENLADRKNFLSQAQAKNLLLQMCDGLKVLHGAGIIHRDIKPSNLILQNEKFIRLIDFDAARIFSADKSADTKFLGTKGYAPPEQFGFGQTDSRSDIYSLGKTFQELLGKNLHGDLKKILSKCTELDPKNRFQSVEELKTALLEEKSPRIKNFFKVLACTAAGILFFPIPLTEKISAPETKIVAQAEKPEKKSPPPKVEAKKNSPFSAEDLKIAPIQIEVKPYTAPTNINVTVQTPAQANIINTTFYLNGEVFDQFTAEPLPVNAKTFSAIKCRLHITNNSDKSFKPRIKLQFGDNFGNNKKNETQAAATLAVGQSTDFFVDMKNFSVDTKKDSQAWLQIWLDGNEKVLEEHYWCVRFSISKTD